MMIDRYDFFGPIHKGLRRALAMLLVRLGAADFAYPAETGPLFEALRRQLVLSALHLEDEDRFLHPAIAERGPIVAIPIHAEHNHHRDTMRGIAALVSTIEAAAPADRPAHDRRLYLAFGRFVADDLAHMLEEETVVQPKLHVMFTDAELAGIEQRIVASLAPADFHDFMKEMLPAMNPAERAGLLSGMRDHAPRAVFDLVIGAAARPSLDDRAWRRLEREMQLAA